MLTPNPRVPPQAVSDVVGRILAQQPAAPEPTQDPSAPPAAPIQDSGLQCLVTLARFHGIAADADQLRFEFARGDAPMDSDELLLAARKIGLMAKTVRPTPKRLAMVAVPAMALDLNGQYFILGRVEDRAANHERPAGRRMLVQQFPQATMAYLEESEFLARWSGELIVVGSRASVLGELAQFDFSWFIPAVVKYRKLLGEVLLVSLVIQLFGLATPMFFQVVMDKVLVNRAFTTLDVIAVGLLAVSVFEVTLTVLRTYIFSHTSSRIDVELGAKLFRHLLNLPVSYFHSRRVGDSVARAQELETIRNFLTGNAITVVLDLVFAVVFIGVMLLYSPQLTLIVVLSLPCYFLLAVLITPVLRARLDEKFKRHAENQSFLVETISGVETIKAMAVEPQWTRRWDQQLAGYVHAGFRTSNLSNLAGNGVTLISKLVTVATMWLGAKLVIEGQLTVGQLVAFNMLAGHVSAPVIRLAQLWNDFQQIGVSVKRLAEILNVRTEVAGSKSAMPTIAGRIEFDQVSFRYRADAQLVMKSLSLVVQPGEVIGIVGRSGSGKSTLAKLAQRMYVPESGRVLIDGIDLALTDASSLRRQIGVVIQENVLFQRSIRDNIALADPGAPLDKVVAAAKLAGAHEFICDLPESYDAMVGEHGVGLSGGQRQRIAIARSLITNPRILVFDEATSALDYESEKVIQDNMRLICAGRTVLIIAHRLSAVRDANRIVVVERGEIVESGSHAELLRIPQGHYAHLYALQLGASA
jgi:subfamily B ATP-binding cassette protein HlyB/CyaB